MSREFYVPCQQYAYPCGSGSAEGVVSVNGVGGMDCMPLRPGPFHYLISEQAKSLVALQELQNEVGALLEFRDLVIETFPNLRHKMAVTAATSASEAASHATSDDVNAASTPNGNASVLMSPNSQGSHIPLPLSSQSPSSRRIGEWEPGKVRRRVAQSRETDSTSSLPRSRSNSHSGGSSSNKQHSATVQDSGFSTETSSKDSASTAIPRPQSPSGRPVLDEAEDELWNLLDVIHRKGVRLREEVESLQGRIEIVGPDDLGDVPSDILDAVRKVTKKSRHRKRLDHPDLDEDLLDVDDDDEDDNNDTTTQLSQLRREKLQLLDKVAELEAETIASRARAKDLQYELSTLTAIKNDLEDRLKNGLIDGNKDNSGIVAPAPHRIHTIDKSNVLPSPRGNSTPLNIGSKDSAFVSVANAGKSQKDRFRTRTIEKNVIDHVNQLKVGRSTEDIHNAVTLNVEERRARLGALDSVLISPSRLSLKNLSRDDIDAKKIAAILKEKEPLELQRHLITTTVHNQVLQKRLDEVQKSTETLSDRLGKANDENEELRFQLAERNIELEGTRARVRVLERLQQRPATETDADDESEPNLNHNGMDAVNISSSSAESSRELLHSNPSDSALILKPSPRRRPSRIPLPGATKALAPKPSAHRRHDSRESLNGQSNNKQSNVSIASTTTLNSTSNTRLKSNRDSSRESLNKSSSLQSKSQVSIRSLPRNNSLGKQTNGNSSNNNNNNNNNSLTRPRDSLESNGGVQPPPSTPPRRPPAPARRSQAQVAANGGANQDNSAKVRTVKQFFWTTWLK